MNNDTKGELKIKQIIATLIILVMTATISQVFIFKQEKIQVAKEETLEIENNIEKAELKSSFERETEVTSRSSEERIIEETQYISIEEITISRDMDLTERCEISKEDFINLMENMRVDYSGFFAENAETIYDLCEEYDINEIFFCGLIAAESGWNIASNHRNTCNYISMMSGGKLIRYSTPEEGLEAAAKLLHNRYLTEDGSCYYGKTLSCVQKRFCPNSSTWVGLVYGCMKQVIK